MFTDLASGAQRGDQSSGLLNSIVLNYLKNDTAKLQDQARTTAAAGPRLTGAGPFATPAPAGPGLGLGPVDQAPKSLFDYLKPPGSGQLITNQPNNDSRHGSFLDLANGNKDKSNGNLAGMGSSMALAGGL